MAAFQADYISVNQWFHATSSTAQSGIRLLYVGLRSCRWLQCINHCRLSSVPAQSSPEIRYINDLTGQCATAITDCLVVTSLLITSCISSHPVMERPYLDVTHNPCGLHATGHIHSVAPDVIVRLPGANHSCQHPPFIQTWGEEEVWDTWYACSTKLGHALHSLLTLKYMAERLALTYA